MTFDPWSPAFVAYPYDAYADLRDRAPVSFFEPTGQWLVARHDDVNALLRDRRLGRTYLHLATHEEMGRPPDDPALAPFWTVIRDGMLDREPPDHTRLRRLVSSAFTPRRVADLRPTVERLATGLAREFVRAGGGDLLAAVAEPLPVTVIAELLGVPDADRPKLRPWSADICGMYELNPSPAAAQQAVRACVEFAEYLTWLAGQRRRDPRDDLVSALAHTDGLSDGELVGTCVLLLNAGHEATVNVTGNGWWALFRNPAQLAKVRNDRSLLTRAVEELMRYDSPLQMFERWVLADDVTVRGVPIRRGSEVALLFGSANHDERVFDRPGDLDVTRVDNPHVSFGAGIHFCLGAALARIELVASFGALLDAAPGLHLVREPEWKPGYIIRGLRSLDVAV